MTGGKLRAWKGDAQGWQGRGVLITGASSGIGACMAELLGQAGARLVLTARRFDRLREVAARAEAAGSSEAHVVEADLSVEADVMRVAEHAVDRLGAVEVLINNAGFAVPGRADRSNAQRTQALLRVNVEACVLLAQRFLPDMVARKAGGILNVASVAGFQCAPFQASYAGSKAFLLNWSNSLHQEMRGTGVRITALCPGVTDTEFFDAAGYRNLTGFLNARMPVEPVSRAGLDAFARGRMEVVPGFSNKAIVFAQRFVPRTWAARVARWLMVGRGR